MPRKQFGVACALVALLLEAEALSGQSALGTAAVSGTVRDENAGVIVGASIKLTEQSKEFVRETFANSTGFFLFPSVGPGVYKLQVAAEGFSPLEVDAVTIEVGGHASLNIILRVGEFRTVMAVADVPALLETETNAIGTVVDARSVSSLPLNGRNFLQLALLAGGATNVSPASNLLATNVGQPGRAVVLPGSMPHGVGYSLNGMPIRGSRDGELALSPSIAAIDQFKVEEGFLMPDRGPNPAVVNIVTKSGSNQFHGELFEFLRNRHLDARSFFASQPEDLKRNQFGFALGGPLRKDRLWFHGFYEGLREITAFSSAGYSPTSDMFAGNLAQTGRSIYDPASYSAAAGARDEFPNAIIPDSRINPVARNLMKYYLPGSSLASRPSNVFGNPRNLLDDDQGGLRLDVAPSGRHQLFVQLFRQRAPADLPGLFPLSGRSYVNSSDLAMIQHSWVLSPAAANALRVGFVRGLAVGGNEARNQGPILKSIGIKNTFDDRGVTRINIAGYSPFGNANGDIGNNDNTWYIDEQFSYIQAGHSFKLGVVGSYRRGWHANATASAHGILDFEPNYTAQLRRNAQGQLLPVENTGDGWADFLMGLPAGGQLSGLPIMGYRGKQAHPFVQDTWKLTGNLTLNYGFSWHLETPPEPQGWVRQYAQGFDRDSGLVTFAALGQMEPKAFGMDLNNFAPRLGLAWRPALFQNTVVRAGAGMYYSEFPWVFSQFSLSSSSIGVGQSFTNPRSSPVPVYELGGNIFPPRTAVTLDQHYAENLPPGAIASAVNPAFRTAYVSQWNFSIQHGLARNDLLEFSYLGSSAHRLPNLFDLNQCRPGSDLFCDPASKPWSRYALLTWIDSSGNASNGALLTKYQHRTSHGLNLRFEYTLAKALTDTWQWSVFPHSQIAACRHCDKGPATFDVRHRAVASAVWEVPFGRRQDGARLVRSVLGGWTLTAIVAMSTGQPSVLKGPNRTESLYVEPVPVRVCDGRSSRLSGTVRTNGFFWFDTTCFTAPAPGRFGNSGRTVLNGPGLNNWDLGIEKSFRFTRREAARITIRGEIFNAWNHTQFQAPNWDLRAGSNFGRVSSTRAPRLIQLGVKLLW